jgi:hypothetical protein
MVTGRRASGPVCKKRDVEASKPSKQKSKSGVGAIVGSSVSSRQTETRRGTRSPMARRGNQPADDVGW